VPAETTSFPIRDVSGWRVAGVEQIGDDEKEWLEDLDGVLWLFKPRTERPDRVQGEDWAEKIAAELARRLSLPAAQVELAVRNGRSGSISRNVVPQGYTIQTGAVLIAGRLPDYQPRTRSREGHSLAMACEVLADAVAPQGSPDLVLMSAVDVFAGFLVFDALIANQDRHEENWSVLLPVDAEKIATLSPSYDHATSLGFNLTDSTRVRLLGETGGVARWARRGLATRFEADLDGTRPSLVTLARRACAQASAEARKFWLLKVSELDDGEVRPIVQSVPHMSDPARTFATALVMENRRRLLDGA
jgi:hypothetical protein